MYGEWKLTLILKPFFLNIAWSGVTTFSSAVDWISVYDVDFYSEH